MNLSKLFLMTFLPILYFIIECMIVGNTVAGVIIEDDRYPYYLKYGSDLKISCVSRHGHHLSFYKHLNIGSKMYITAQDGDFELTNISSRHHDNVKKLGLIKKNLTFEDSGNYYCEDQLENTFEISVKVLKIHIKHSMKRDSLMLTCFISGFNENPPVLEMEWHRSDELLKKFKHNQIIKEGRYHFKFDDYIAKLDINELEPGDVSVYACAFNIPTSKGTFQIHDHYDLTDINHHALINDSIAMSSYDFNFTLISVLLFVLFI